MEFQHVTVLLNEMINLIVTDPEGIYVDCTLGGGGHSRALAERLSDQATLIGLDQDSDAITAAVNKLEGTACRFIPVQRNFQDIGNVLDMLCIEKVDGIMFDLGVSSYQLDTPERGFSYMQDGPLDMRMDRDQKRSAYDIVNGYSQADLYRIIKTYGEERWAKRIAAFIVEARREKPLERTEELVQVIKKAIPAGARKDGPHPAKRTFQAIRIEVNHEMDALKSGLDAAVRWLNPGGRICVISYHSLEDRIVKDMFQSFANRCTCPPDLPVCMCGKEPILKVLTRKPIVPTADEIARNPRARSAKLRVAQKL